MKALLIHTAPRDNLAEYKCSPGVLMMDDDLTDGNDFDLGLPSPLEMARQECSMLHSELRGVWSELRRARSNVAKLVQMNSLLTSNLDALRRECDKAHWELSDLRGRTENFRPQIALSSTLRP